MNTKEPKHPKLNSFFAGYVVIRPSGRRKFCRSFLDYCKTIMFFLETDHQTVAETNYSTYAVLEEEVEERFKLPNEHLLGATEVYTNLLQILCIAKFEADRFERNKFNPPTPNRTHLDLFLIASLQPGQQPDCDIVRRTRVEDREFCSCLICWPSATQEPLWVLDEKELDSIHKILHISTIPINVYLPFRRQSLRKNAQEPVAIQEVREPK